MNDDLRPDLFDDELRRRFGAGAAHDGDPDVVLDAMRPRLQQARMRRRASFASAIAGAAVVVVVLAFVFGTGGGGGGSVRTPPASNSPATTAPTAPTTTAPNGGTVTQETTPSTVDDHGDDSTTATTPTVPESTPNTNAPPAISPAPPHDETFTSDGGTIVVRLADGQVSLVSSSPAPGFTAETTDNGPTRVEVRFSNGQVEWRIRVDLDNGVLVPEISSHG
jgi:hypothetical protein